MFIGFLFGWGVLSRWVDGNERECIYGELEKENKHLLLVIHIFVIERCLALDFLKFSRHFESFSSPFCLGNLSLLSFMHTFYYTFFSQDGYIAFVVYLKKTETRIRSRERLLKVKRELRWRNKHQHHFHTPQTTETVETKSTFSSPHL